jgi:hypothetical protein
MSLMLFTGVGSLPLGWLVFKISERMRRNRTARTCFEMMR